MVALRVMLLFNLRSAILALRGKFVGLRLIASLVVRAGVILVLTPIALPTHPSAHHF